jgi:hypothetical protein
LIDGLLTERDLQDIRAQLEGFDRISGISDEMRDVIVTLTTTWVRANGGC